MREKLRDKAKGRWHGILSGLGLAQSFLTRKHGPCPMCGGNDRWRWIDREGSGDWICNNCGHGSGTDLVMKVLKVDFKTAAQRIEEQIGTAPVVERVKADPKKLLDDMAYLWSRSNPITPDCPPGRYLAARGLDPLASPVLRWGSSVTYPMMVAKVISPDHKAVNLHRTLLDSAGRKANVEKPKLLMEGETPAGSAVRLNPPVNGRLGVAEGIETALSAAKLFDVPCWATIHSAGLERFTPPDGVTELMIFGDNDQKYGGQASAYRLAHRMACIEMHVTISIPDSPGEDWNDVLRRTT